MARSRRRPIIWSPEARSDLSDIWNYDASAAGRQAANKIVHEIGQVAEVQRRLADPEPKFLTLEEVRGRFVHRRA